MTAADIFDASFTVSSPPPGSVNVRLGKVVEGPGGRWVPCATKVEGGFFYSGLFQVGPGRRQVCSTDRALPCPEQALSRAIELASSAAS